MAQFDGVAVPVTSEGVAEIGDIVRITGFNENDVEIAKDTNQGNIMFASGAGTETPSAGRCQGPGDPIDGGRSTRCKGLSARHRER